MDDLEECWADIRPPKPPSPPEEEITPGCLWVGLFDGEHEVHVEGYRRIRCAVPPGPTMDFRATFPTSFIASVSRVGLFLKPHGDNVLWIKDFDRLFVTAGTTLQISLVVNDLEGAAGEFCGFRKVLQLSGVL